MSKTILSAILARLFYQVTQRWHTPTIAEAVSMRTVFPREDVEQLFRVTGSWDVVVAAAGYASINGVGDLMLARSKMIKDNPGVSIKQLLDVYGVI